jgi:hypothetical protein
MLDQVDYNIDGDGHQGNGNGYHNLDGDWLTYYKVAKNFTRKVRREDREDFLHDLLLAMARVKTAYDAKGKELTEGGLVRIAQYEVNTYWRKSYLLNSGINCGMCVKKQRQRCKERDLYRQCPKAVKIESLDQLVDDGDGNKVELYQMIADDNAVDLVAVVDARLTLQGYPVKAVKLLYKRYAGYPLDKRERAYLSRFSRRAQKTLV